MNYILLYFHYIYNAVASMHSYFEESKQNCRKIQKATSKHMHLQIF